MQVVSVGQLRLGWSGFAAWKDFLVGRPARSRWLGQHIASLGSLGNPKERISTSHDPVE
jgi:hypothetical protein